MQPRFAKSKTIPATLFLLLFARGLTLGSNPHVGCSFGRFGLEAQVLAVAGTTGSIAVTWGVGRLCFRMPLPAPLTSTLPTPPAHRKSYKLHSTNLLLLLALGSGFAAGRWNGTFPVPLTHQASFWLLCIPMLQADVLMSSNPGIEQAMRAVQPSLLLIPLATIGGTLAGSAAASLLLPRWSTTDCLAVGSGFGYYSLSSVLVVKYKTACLGAETAAELGVVALLANLLRELTALFSVPFLVRCFGPLTAVSAAGANSLDLLLPRLQQTTGNAILPVALLHGITVDLSVPLLTGFFCSI